MTHTTHTRSNVRQLTAINKIVEPWLPVNTERLLWTVTLNGGTEVTICCPLGAAVEVEQAGHSITALR